MATLTFQLDLLSDGEPGSGLGTEIVNALLPRNAAGDPVIPASHIKGLLRDFFESLTPLLGDRWTKALGEILGAPGGDGDDGVRGCVHFSDARVVSRDDVVRTITRTAIGPLGTVSGMTLRTSEAFRSGTALTGTLQFAAPADGVTDLALRTGLLALESVGSSRTRGAGSCRVTINGEGRTPGALLRALSEALARSTDIEPATAESPRGSVLPDADVVWCRLRFDAEGPVCCLETPLVENNVLRGGPAIPASAVQGALLTRLSRLEEGLATACFESPAFRVWPLLPVPTTTDGSFVASVRVDLAHRMSKLPGADGEYAFTDVAIQPYDWKEYAGGSPLKASDGLLLRDRDGIVRLWRSQDLPRVFAAHAVHPTADGSRKRSLFTVEALAPLRYTGQVALPRAVFDALDGSLRRDPWMVFGRSQGVRGGGMLALEPLDDLAGELSGWTLPGAMTRRVFVVQSPLVIPDDWQVDRAERTLAMLVEKQGWGEVCVDEQRDGNRVARTMATCAVRFGWNRRGLGDRVRSQNRLAARRVILPGSVFVLRSPLDPEQLLERLRVGVGDGRASGFGAVMPHPGIAKSLYQDRPRLQRLKSGDAGRDALDLLASAGSDAPTPSQIAEFAQRVSAGGDKAAEYLERQRQRSGRYWRVWAGLAPWLKQHLATDTARVAAALRVLQDLVITARDDASKD